MYNPTYNQLKPVVTDSHGHKSSTWKAGNSTTFSTQLIQELDQKEQQMAPGPSFVAGHGWIKGGSTGVAQGGHKPSQHVPAFAPGKHEL